MILAPVINAQIWGFGSIYSDIWTPDLFASSDDVITNHVEKALSLFITQFRQTRTVNTTSRYATFSIDNDPISGGVVIDTEAPITNHVERAKSLFITQFKQTRSM